MRIAIDLSAVRSTGTRVYTDGFLPELIRIGSAHRFLVFCSRDMWGPLQPVMPSNVEHHETGTGSVPMRLLWEQAALPIALKRWRADVLFAPFDVAPVLLPCPMVLAIRNPMPTLILQGGAEASWAMRAKSALHQTMSRMACRTAEAVFFPTAFAAEMLGDALGVPAAKRSVIFHGTDHARWSNRVVDRAVLAAYDLEPQRYILFVSRLYPQKRADTLIEGFARLPAEARKGLKLVFAGSAPNEVTVPRLVAIARRYGVASETRFLGEVPRERMGPLFTGALAFVLPSAMETFGQPFVEAMASGAPAIVGDIKVARELCGDAAMYFPVGDSTRLSECLARVIESRELREAMGARGERRARDYSWPREARETLALLERHARHADAVCSPNTARAQAQSDR